MRSTGRAKRGGLRCGLTRDGARGNWRLCLGGITLCAALILLASVTVDLQWRDVAGRDPMQGGQTGRGMSHGTLSSTSASEAEASARESAAATRGAVQPHIGRGSGDAGVPHENERVAHAVVSAVGGPRSSDTVATRPATTSGSASIEATPSAADTSPTGGEPRPHVWKADPRGRAEGEGWAAVYIVDPR